MSDIASAWTVEKVQQLRTLWLDGVHIVEIAAKLDMTKGQISGKSQRLGLPMRKPGPVTQTRRYEKAPVCKPPAVAEAAKATPRFVSLMNLLSGDCRWPMGDPRDPGFLYCGDNVRDGSSYCAAHHAIAYTPSTTRRPGKGDVRSAGGSQNETPVRVNF